MKNIGNNVFYLNNLSTSCDCTKASCDWKELNPGDSGIISIYYKAERIGNFLRIVNVNGNIEEEPFMLIFTGIVK